MIITDVFKSEKIALVATEVASNKIPYLGKGFFPPKKKMGLDLSWFKTSKGLPVALKPSAFDTVSTLRSREGFKEEETEMAFFKESMLIKEKDEQEMMRIQDSKDPYASALLAKIYDDTTTLVEGAEVIPERMIWQLLAPQNSGKPSISFQGDGATYEYDYDPDGSWTASNYTVLTGTSAWTDSTNADPLADISTACDEIEQEKGVRPTTMIIAPETMSYLKKSAKVKGAILAQNVTANLFMTDARVKELFKTEIGVDIIVYSKKYKAENGNATQFMPNGFVTLVPDGALGNTWYGVTPEERSGLQHANADFTLYDNRIAVTVSQTVDPVQTKTTVSEIVLPSYERMDEVAVLKVY